MDGFWSAVNANKSYPPMAVRRNIEGDVTVQVTLDSGGNLVAADVISSTNSLLADAALKLCIMPRHITTRPVKVSR